MTGSGLLIAIAWLGWVFAGAGWGLVFLKWRWGVADRRALIDRYEGEIKALRGRTTPIGNGARP